jgi:hypothetical protein
MSDPRPKWSALRYGCEPLRRTEMVRKDAKLEEIMAKLLQLDVLIVLET